MTVFDRAFLRVYRRSLSLLPSSLRSRYADDMLQLVHDRMAEGRHGGGHCTRWRRAWSELIDVLRTALTSRSAAADDALVVSHEEQAGRRHRGHRSGAGFPVGAAARRLVRRPTFAITVVLILGLGGGAATALFAVVDAVLIRPLPYRDSQQLVMAWRTVPSAGLTRSSASYPDYLDLRASAASFTSLAATAFATGVLLEGGEAERVDGSRVSGNLFATLGNAPAFGRTIVDADDMTSAEPVVVLSDGLWKRRFGADSSIVARHITIGDRQYRVVGIMPPGFSYPSPRAQYWVPLRLDAARAERDRNFLTLVGRLREGVTAAAAQTELRSLLQGINRTHPGVNDGNGLVVEERHHYVVRDVQRLLLIISGAVVLLVAISCANVANLHVVRAVSRWRELAVRRSIGATRWRLAAEQLAESVLLAVCATVLAGALGAALLRAVLAFGPALPRSAEIALSARALGVGGAITALCALLTGVLPYVGQLARIDANVGVIRSTTPRHAYRLQHALVAAQLALTLMLAVGAALLGQSFSRLVSVPRGFDGARVLTAKLSLPDARYATTDATQAFFDRLTRQLEASPGVEQASGTWALPFSEDFASSALVPADRPVPAKPLPVGTLPVRIGFFSTLGVPLRAGRDFTATDRATAPGVAVVNEALARQFWGSTNVLGKALRSANPENGDRNLTIVGVVADMKRRGLDVATQPEVYLPHAQAEWAGGDLYLTVRVAGTPAAYVSTLRRIVRELDPLLPLTSVGTLDQFVEATIVAPRFRTLLIMAFAAFASLLSLVGVYAATSFIVAQRRRDIAVRGALGATPARLFADVFRSGMFVATIGIGAGALGASLAVPMMQSVLFDIAPLDAATFGGAATTLALAVAAACLPPARRASRMDPMGVLRETGV